MIIVTGGAGMIGSNIIKALNERGIADILVVNHLKNGRKFKNLVDLQIADYMDWDDFLAQIMACDDFGFIDAIFHEGACSATTEWDGKYVMLNNYEYSKELLHYCLIVKYPSCMPLQQPLMVKPIPLLKNRNTKVHSTFTAIRSSNLITMYAAYG